MFTISVVYLGSPLLHPSTTLREASDHPGDFLADGWCCWWCSLEVSQPQGVDKHQFSLCPCIIGGMVHIMLYTLPKTNIASENRVSKKENSLPTIHFQGLCWFRGGCSSSHHHGNGEGHVPLRRDGIYSVVSISILIVLARFGLPFCLLCLIFLLFLGWWETLRTSHIWRLCWCRDRFDPKQKKSFECSKINSYSLPPERRVSLKTWCWVVWYLFIGCPSRLVGGLFYIATELALS